MRTQKWIMICKDVERETTERVQGDGWIGKRADVTL